jgi:hypothetical protein
LPSSLTTAISSTLGYSPHPPVSVYGTDTNDPSIEAFLGSTIRISLRAKPSHSHLDVKRKRICLSPPSTCLDQDIQYLADLSPLRPPIGQTEHWWYRNIKPIFHRLRLSASTKGPTNPEQISFTQETLDFRCSGFSPELSLLMLAYSFLPPPVCFTTHLRRLAECSPTPR